jgi:hypothetical protein
VVVDDVDILYVKKKWIVTGYTNIGTEDSSTLTG